MKLTALVRSINRPTSATHNVVERRTSWEFAPLIDETRQQLIDRLLWLALVEARARAPFAILDSTNIFVGKKRKERKAFGRPQARRVPRVVPRTAREGGIWRVVQIFWGCASCSSEPETRGSGQVRSRAQVSKETCRAFLLPCRARVPFVRLQSAPCRRASTVVQGGRGVGASRGEFGIGDAIADRCVRSSILRGLGIAIALARAIRSSFSLSLSLCVCVCACVFPERASKFIYSPGLPGCIALMVLALRNSAIFNSPPPIDTGRAFEIDKTKRIRCMSISHVSPLLTCNVKFSGRPGSTVRRMPSRIYSQSFRAPSASRLLLLRPLCSIHISLPSPPPRPHSSPSFSFGVKRAIFIASIVFTYISSIPRFEDDKIRLAERETVIRRNEITGRLDERYAVCLYLERRPLWLEINFGGEPCEMRRNRTWKRDIVVSSLVTFSISTLASSQWSNDLRIKAIKLRTSRRDTRARQRNIRKNLASLCENRDFRDHIAVTFVHENRCAYRSESPSYEEKYEKCEKCKQEIANYESENGQSG